MAPLLAFSSLLLLCGAAVGLLLRMGHVIPLPWLATGNALHAHSHTLYWGWAGLAVLSLLLERVGETGTRAKVALWGVGGVGACALPVFLAHGYERPGVVLAALSVFPFGTAALLAHRGLVRARGPDVALLRSALLMMPVAYLAALSRVVLKVLGHASPTTAGVAVHLFLGAFGSFFALGLAGLWVHALRAPPSPALTWLARCAPLLPLPSLLAVQGLEGTPLGAVVRVATVLCVFPVAGFAHWAWRQGAVARSVGLSWLAGSALSALSAVRLLPPAWANRHGAVLVIHLQTLSVVTTSLLWLLESRGGSPRRAPVLAHQGATLLMLAGLGGASLGLGRPALALAAVGGTAALALQGWLALPRLLPRADTSLRPAQEHAPW